MRTVVASQLEEHLAKAALYDLANLTADRLAAREGDHVDAWAPYDSFASSLATSHQSGDRARNAVLLQHAGDYLRHRDGAERRARCGLPKRRIARSERQGQVPAVHGHGEVECGKDRDNSEGVGYYDRLSGLKAISRDA